MTMAFLQAVINCLAAVLEGISSIMLDSPFRAISEYSLTNDILEFINWIIPVGAIVAILQFWVAAILVYYSYSAIMRIVKLIG